MNCEDILARVESRAVQPLTESDRQGFEKHISVCEECRSALRGSDAMHDVRNQGTESARDGLFDEIVGRIASVDQDTKQDSRFWLGAGFGSVAAAVIVAAFMSFGIVGEPEAETVPSIAADFTISMQETRDLNIAIDVDHAIAGARMSITLSGGVEIAGYSGQQELSWTDDLVAGVNKLTLPLIALDQSGGQMIVKLDHDDKHQVFFVNLKTSG